MKTIQNTKLLTIFLTTFFFFFSTNSLADVYMFTSAEVGNNNANSRFHTEILQNEWRNRAAEFGVCEGSYITGDLSAAVIDAINTNEMTLNFAGINITLSNRDMDGPLQGSPGGDVTLSTSSTLQDGAPRPENLVTGSPSFYSETTGSDGTRNGTLITFDVPQSVFGIWFGDLESNSMGTEAFIRFFDNTGAQIGTDTPIPSSTQWLDSEGIAEGDCGGSIRGCGNRTSRFVGFIADEDTPVTSMVVVVGDDDLGDFGLREHMSAIGPTVPTDFSCGDSNLEISKFAIDELTIGNNLLYTIVVNNHGPADATNTVVTDTLPTGVTFVSATSSDGSTCTESSGIVSCDLGIFVSGDPSVVIEIEVTPNSEGNITNNVEISSDENDPDNSDNTAFVDTNVSTSVGTGEPVICELEDLSSAYFTIDGSASTMLKAITSASNFLKKRKKNGTCSKNSTSNLNNLNSEARQLHSQIWQTTWQNLPLKSYDCSGDTGSNCSTFDSTSTTAEIQNNLDALQAIGQEILNNICIKGTNKRKQLLKKLNNNHKAASEEIDNFDTEIEVCEF